MTDKPPYETLAELVGIGTGHSAVLIAHIFEHQIANGTADPLSLSRLLRRLEKRANENGDHAPLYEAIRTFLFGTNDSRRLALTALAQRRARSQPYVHLGRPKKKRRT